MYLLISRLIHAGSRRHVVVLCAGLVFVVVVGAALYAAAEGIAFTTGLYWAITTASTVGYGDVTPHNGIGQVVASVVMLTSIPMLGALFAVVAGASISSGIRRLMQMQDTFPDGSYRLIIGMHPTVPAILTELLDARESVVLVADVDPSTVPDAVHVIKGDPTEPAVIGKARPAGAQHALVTSGSDGDVLVSTIQLRQLAPELSITALSSSGAVREALTALGVTQTVSVDDLVAHTLAKSLEIPHAGSLIEELLDSDDCSLIEIDADADAIGAKLSSIRRDHDGLVLGLVHEGAVSLGITSDPVVQAGDHLLIAVETRTPARG